MSMEANYRQVLYQPLRLRRQRVVPLQESARWAVSYSNRFQLVQSSESYLQIQL